MADVASDVKDLLSYLRDHASELNIEKTSICAWACSAGVPYLQAVVETRSDYIKCLVVYYGMMNFQQFADTFPPEMPDIEREVVTDIFKRFSLLYYLVENTAAIPPMLIAQAKLDDETINKTIDQFAVEAAALGVKVEFFQHPEGHHGFDVLDDDDRSKSIIGQTLDFIRRHLV